MKKILKILIIFICTLSFSLTVNAGAGYSGDGKKFTGDGTGGSGTCRGGYCLQLSAMIKFTLVDISGDEFRPLGQYLMKNTSNTHYMSYFLNNNEDDSEAIRGLIMSDGKYSYSAFGIGNYEVVTAFSSINSIINKSQGLNFSSDTLKASIIKNYNKCNEALLNCEITDEYEKLILYILKKQGIIRNEVTKLKEETLTSEEKLEISKLRIIVEPIYTFKKNNVSKYIFATTKAAALMIDTKYPTNEPLLGTYIDFMYNNLIAKEKVGTVLNNYASGYILYSNLYSEKQLNALRNPNDGAGYAVVKLIYNIPETKRCTIEKKDGKYLYYDNLERAYNDASENFEYFLNQCGCSILSDVPEEIKNKYPDIYTNFDNSCNPKSCDYYENKGVYTFYKNNGSMTTQYNEFIKSCSCNHPRVLSLKTSFSTIYNNECPPEILPPSETTVTSNLKTCTVSNDTENYIIEKNDTKIINSYCSLNCKETINFNDVYGKYTVKAGQYFELKKYPSLIANKSCEVKVNYTGNDDSWLSVYNDLAGEQAKWVTETNKYTAVENASPTSELCSCPLYGGSCTYADKYSVTYTSYEFSAGSFTKKTDNTLTWGGCSNKAKPSIDSTASSKFSETIGKIDNLFKNLKTCSVYLNQLDGTEMITTATDKEQFYTFKEGLKYYYYQDYSKTDISTTRNDAKPNNVDDSDMKSSLEFTHEDGNYSSYKNDTKSYNYFSSLNNITSKAVGIDNYSTAITRKVIYNYAYAPAKLKSVNSFTASIENGSGDNKNKIQLKNVFDIDISAIAKTDNENYFSFTSLGDDNSIYDWFNDGKEVKINGYERNANINDSIDSDLNRACTYEITNDLVKCDNVNNCKLNIVYRSVDPASIDPNGRLKINAEGDIGFSNWDNEKGYLVKEKIEETEKTKDTYSPNNLEYSFTLDSATIAAIRSYNEGKKYDDWETYFECINGNECESNFITQASDGTFKDENNENIKAFAQNISGRNKWKYMTYNESTLKWSIENYNRGVMTQALFEDYKEKLGGLTP